MKFSIRSGGRWLPHNLRSLVRSAQVALLVSISAVSVSAQTNSAAVAAAAQAYLATLSPAQSNAVVYAPVLTNAWHWSNFPIYEAARSGLSMETLNSTQRSAFLNLAYTALSSAGTNFYEQIRAMDEYLRQNVNPTNYSGDKYYISLVGTPSSTSPWLLQLSGHHASYNNIYNAPYVSGTPMFIGTEPNIYTNNNEIFRPLGVPADIISALRQTLTGAAQLSGSYTEVAFGVTPQTGYDDSWPNVYPTTGRGQLYTNLNSTQQGLVLQLMNFYVNQLPEETAARLRFDYQNPAALAQTYVGFAGVSNLATLGSYFRIDGPRVWIELSSRPGVAYTFPHWHSIWRDKLADYGAAYGATTISTTNQLPVIGANPNSVTNVIGANASFSVSASGQGPLFYQWLRNGENVPGATNASILITATTYAEAGDYRCRVWNFMGARDSAPATLRVLATNFPTFSVSATNGGITLLVNGDAGPQYFIEASTNLSNWETVHATNPAAMPFKWADPQQALLPARYFRVRYLP